MRLGTGINVSWVFVFSSYAFIPLCNIDSCWISLCIRWARGGGGKEAGQLYVETFFGLLLYKAAKARFVNLLFVMLKPEDPCCCVAKQRWALSYCCPLSSSFVCTVHLEDPNLDGDKVWTSCPQGAQWQLGAVGIAMFGPHAEHCRCYCVFAGSVDVDFPQAVPWAVRT